LSEQLLAEMDDGARTEELPQVARYFELDRGRHRLVELVVGALSGGAPNALHRSIAALRPHSIFTTNFDELLEAALRDERVEFTTVTSDEEAPYLSSQRCDLVKIHGTISRPGSIVLTSRDYETFDRSRPAIARLLATTLQTRTVLFVGYSVTDINLRQILSVVHEEIGSLRRRLYMLAFALSKYERLDLESRGIEVLDLGPLDDGDPTQRASEWVDRFRNEVSSSIPGDRAVAGVLRGREERTREIVRAIGEVDVDPSKVIVRLRQGFGTLSLGDDEHPNAPEYSALLVRERDGVKDLLDRGAEVRLIVGRRPVFSSDLTHMGVADVELARRLLGRCLRLMGLLTDVLTDPEPVRLLVVVSTVSHFADVAIGLDTLFRGTRSDSTSLGYTMTTVTRDADGVRDFVTAFDTEFDELANGVDWLGSGATAVHALARSALPALRSSADVLQSWLDEADGDRRSE
jgi:hypothetical protein